MQLEKWSNKEIIMRKPIIAGNWKMNKTRDEALDFIYAVKDNLPSKDEVETVICAPYVILRDLVKRQGDNLVIGAENMHYAESGAFTGEISPNMLTSLGVTYVIIGHSERRAMFNETNEACNKKLKAAYDNGLKPILCVGETLEQREGGQTEAHLSKQIKEGLKGLTEEEVENLVIAYEPIWAIGTGKTATAEVADETCGFIRSCVKNLYNEKASEAVRIQYGGSVKPANVEEIMSKINIDGALVGGAALKADSFITLAEAPLKLK